VAIDNSQICKYASCALNLISMFLLTMLMIHVAIFQRHQRMDFTFHTAYVILKRVHITAIFWTGISCWLKQATMTRLRCWNRYTNYWARWSFRSTMDLFPFTYNFTFLHHLQDVYWTGLWV